MRDLEKYAEARNKRSRRFQQAFSIVALAGFAGAIFGPVLTVLNPQREVVPSPSAEQTAEQSLQAEKQGYEAVLQREPTNQSALEGLVRVHLLSNNLEAAIPYVEKLVALNPDRPDYQQVLTQLQQQIRQGSTAAPDQAKLRNQRRSYELALESNPNNPEALEGLVAVTVKLGDTTTAIASLEKLVALYPERQDYQKQLAALKQAARQE